MAAVDTHYAAGCAATSVKANATVIGNTFAHECFGDGDGGLARSAPARRWNCSASALFSRRLAKPTNLG